MKNLILKWSVATVLATQSFAGGGGDIYRSSLMIDQLEFQFNDEKVHSWDGFIYGGYDINKLYLYSEGEKPKDGKWESENQLVLSHAIAPFWDIQAGIGYDKTEDESQTWVVLALQGLAPYFFETRTALLVGEDGNIGVRLSAEYEALFTQNLILTPSIETALYTKDTKEMGIGKGLSNITAGVRLRYEIKREFAPYIGFEWSKNFGNTEDFSSLDEGYVVAGFRAWF